MGKMIIGGAVVLAAVFAVLAGVYWTTPADALPPYLPGFEAGSQHIHFKHGLGSAIMGLAILAFAWFRLGPQKA